MDSAQQAFAQRLAVAGPGIYVPPGAALELRVHNGAAGVTVTIRGRFLALENGQIGEFTRDLVPATDRSASTFVLSLQEGVLYGGHVFVSAGTPIYGQTFAIVTLFDGVASSSLPLETLAAGAITAIARLPLRANRIASSLEGVGAIRSVTGTDQAAGSEVSETVPTGARWRLRSIDVALVTDGTVANREVVLTIDDGTNIVAEVVSAVAQTATQTRRYTGALGVQRGAPAAATIIDLPLPDLLLRPGYRIRTVTTGIVAGDNWGAPQLAVEEWMET